ncbi:MAG: serine acetyltransferase [Clostridia bacterium]|nr:serine acetyltransferase [Clostridia bacterium]
MANFEELSKKMAQAYKESDITMLSCLALPDKNEIISIIEDIQGLFFPAYFAKADACLEPTEFCEKQIGSIYFKVKKQIELALSFNHNDSPSERAKEIAEEFVSRLPDIHALLIKDVIANYEGDPAAQSKEEVIFSYPGFYAIFIYRVANLLYKSNVPLVPRIMSEYAHSKTGVDINPGATIGEYFFIDHGTGIVIGETTVIGNHVKLYQGVTLGALSPRKGQSLSGVKRHPTVCDNVTIYSGASILGGETIIGEGAVIGGNSFITESIASGAKVYVKKPEHIIKN